MANLNYDLVVDAIMRCIDEVLEKHEVSSNVLQDMTCSCGQDVAFPGSEYTNDNPYHKDHLSAEIKKALKEAN